MIFLVTQPFKTSNYKAMILHPYNQKIVQITDLPLHIPTMMNAMTIPLPMVEIALLLNKNNYLRNNMRKGMIYSLMLTMSDGTKYITPDKSIPTDGGLTCDLFLDIVPSSPIAFF